MSEKLKVNVGDEILHYHNGIGVRNELPSIVKVVKVTPTGRIRIDRYPDVQFNEYGSRMGGDSWHRPYIKVPTAEQLEEVKEKHFIRNVIRKMHQVENLSREQAVAILKILKAGDQDA